MSNDILGQYVIGGRLIISHGNPNALQNVIINTNPIDYESLLISDDEWHSMFKLQETLENIKSQSESKLEIERNEKLTKLFNTIKNYKTKYNIGKTTAISGNDKALRYLQVEFPKFSSNNKQIIYNEYIKSDDKPLDFLKYFIESGIDLNEIKKILFDGDEN